MNDIQQKLLDFFTNEKLLKGVRSSLVTVIIIILPFLYFGYKSTFTLDALFNFDFGALIVIITISVILATKETKSQCFDLTCENDDELPTLHNEVKDNSLTIRNKDKTGKSILKWLLNYNKEQQEMYNAKLTTEKIEELEKRIINYRIVGKVSKADKLEKEVERLKKHPLHDKHFVPYSVKKILNTDKNAFKFKKKKGNNEINVNPKKINWTFTLINTIIRSSGVGVAGTIPFILGEPFSTIMLFYLGYILIIAITVISQWILTSYTTTHEYKSALITIKTIQEQLLAELPTLVLTEQQLADIPFIEEQEVIE